MLPFFLLGAVVYVSAVRPVDLPETAFNEADTPTNLALPAGPADSLAVQTALKVVRYPSDPIVMRSVPPFRSDYVVLRSARILAVMLRQRHRHSLQDLLCSFLI